MREPGCGAAETADPLPRGPTGHDQTPPSKHSEQFVRRPWTVAEPHTETQTPHTRQAFKNAQPFTPHTTPTLQPPPPTHPRQTHPPRPTRHQIPMPAQRLPRPPTTRPRTQHPPRAHSSTAATHPPERQKTRTPTTQRPEPLHDQRQLTHAADEGAIRRDSAQTSPNSHPHRTHTPTPPGPPQHDPARTPTSRIASSPCVHARRVHPNSGASPRDNSPPPIDRHPANQNSTSAYGVDSAAHRAAAQTRTRKPRRPAVRHGPPTRTTTPSGPGPGPRCRSRCSETTNRPPAPGPSWPGAGL
ncbi:hypothetical protein BX257_8749 [Streptomyces sp. 3212.3]|nr:hypothetical protein BX257_8749 [Streptomyces sp. 3212.3]